MTDNDNDKPDARDGDYAFRGPKGLGRGVEMTYGGALSFLRRPYSRDLTGVDVAVTGLPYDTATTYRPGARLGPRAIRAGSVQLAELNAFPFGFDPFDHLSVVDYGDCFIDPHHPETVVEDIQAHMAGILAEGVMPLMLGGDHFATYPALRAVHAAHGPVALLHFDAHSDTWPDDGVRFDHGSMFLRAKREGLIDVSRSIQVGIRSANQEDHGFEILTAPWIQRNGWETALDVIRGRIGTTPLYLTFDIDCLDPAFAPGTGTPVPGGLSSQDALALIRGLRGLDIRAADVMEVAPAYDHAEITAIAAATIAHDILCLKAIAKGAEVTPIGRV